MKIFLIIISFLTLILLFYFLSQKPDGLTVEIRDKSFQTEVVKSIKDKEVGLSKYDNLGKEKGMLFLFDEEANHPFWMKDMKFPIDIIYIKDGRITEIYPNVPPPNKTNGEIRTIEPKNLSDSVFEINANLSKQYGFKIGDSVLIKVK